MKLYEIANEYQHALNKLQAMDDFTEKELEDNLSGIQASLDNKVIAGGYFIKSLESDIDAIKKAQQELADRKKYLENKITNLKSYFKFNMERTKTTNIKCPYFEVKLRKTRGALDVINEQEIPEEYFKTTRTLKKDEVRKNLDKDFRLYGLAKVVPTQTVVITEKFSEIEKND